MIKLVAIDLDGTLFNEQSQVTEENKKALFHLQEKGIYPVISTGRPFNGIPEELKKDFPFSYAITANGSGVYDVKTGECIFEDSMDGKISLPIISFLTTKDIHMDAFISGVGISTFKCAETAMRLNIPEALRRYIVDSRIRVPDLVDHIVKNNLRVQKMTLNFYHDEDGNLVDRAEVKEFLENNPAVDCVCGGYNNLEFTKHGVSKGAALRKLAEHLGIAIEDTMAIGDTENDLSIIQAAGHGIAMGNAIPLIKEASEYVTASNEESGVAKAIYHYCNN